MPRYDTLTSGLLPSAELCKPLSVGHFVVNTAHPLWQQAEESTSTSPQLIRLAVSLARILSQGRLDERELTELTAFLLIEFQESHSHS